MSATTTTPVEQLVALREARDEAVREAQREADGRFAASVRELLDEHRLSVTAACDAMGMSRTNMHRLLREHPEATS